MFQCGRACNKIKPSASFDEVAMATTSSTKNNRDDCFRKVRFLRNFY